MNIMRKYFYSRWMVIARWCAEHLYAYAEYFTHAASGIVLEDIHPGMDAVTRARVAEQITATLRQSGKSSSQSRVPDYLGEFSGHCIHPVVNSYSPQQLDPGLPVIYYGDRSMEMNKMAATLRYAAAENVRLMEKVESLTGRNEYLQQDRDRLSVDVHTLRRQVAEAIANNPAPAPPEITDEIIYSVVTSTPYSMMDAPREYGIRCCRNLQDWLELRVKV